jgi:hypothetical protein
MREALCIPHRRVQKLARFDRDEVMAWAKRWVQDVQDQGLDVKADPASQSRLLLHAWHRCPSDRRIRAVDLLLGRCTDTSVVADAPLPLPSSTMKWV